jgi:hypothetical protein
MINFNKFGNKTISTENDFINFHKNAVNKILNSKKINNKESIRPYLKPDFIKYKFPQEDNKIRDLELEKIKMYSNRKNRSSQIKSRVFESQYNVNINILSKLKQHAENSNFYKTAKDIFSFNKNNFGKFEAINFSNNTFEIKFGNDNNLLNINKKRSKIQLPK